MHIYIDADACPVKDETIRVSQRHDIQVTMVSNQGMRPIQGVKQVVVSEGFDAADNWIVENITAGDIVITSDIPLAARALAKGSKALKPNGDIFTPQNIGSALATRELNSYLRETGEIKGYNPSFGKKDRSKFLQSLDKLLQKNNR